MTVKIQVRRGTATQWNTADPTLSQGEIGYETNTGKFKVGNGTDVWSDLNYFIDETGIAGLISGAALDTTDDLAEGTTNKYFSVQRVNDALNSGTLNNISFTYNAGAIDVSVPTVQGTTGSQGAQGTQGTQGVQGPTGPQGTQGLQGMQGLQGTQGPQGTVGAQGVQGGTGTQGIQGETGVQGVQGVQGGTGTQGTTGTQGAQGVQGTQGNIGSQGTTGATGGSTSNFNYKADTATTDSAPGSGKLRWNNATQTSATFLYVDHINDSSVDIDVYLALLKQYDHLIVQAKADSNVYITYEVTGAPTVVSNSYVKIPVTSTGDGGTGSNSFDNADQIELVIFTTGLQGAQGTVGSTGAQGTTGSTGAQGTTGAQGETGTQGVQGTTGAQGVQGETGTQGVQGTQGETGTQGSQGATGPQGTTGAQGTTGTQGATGTQGVQGPAGSYTTSSQLATALSDETGSGALVFGSSPTLKGPVYFQSAGGAGGSNNKIDVNNSTGAVTLTSGYPLNLTASGDVTITATGGAAKVGSDTIATLTASQTMSSKTLSNTTLSGYLIAGGVQGTAGQVLTATGTQGVQWAAAAADATPVAFLLGGM